MSFTEHGSNLGNVSEAHAKAELERILRDERLRVTDRHREILKYLSDLYFKGCDDGAKAYSIAIDVLGRTCNFEPSLDPIVRIEMSRLRSALDAYYSAFGDETTVWLKVPRGRYVVHFIMAPGRSGGSTGIEEISSSASLSIEDEIAHPQPVSWMPANERLFFVIGLIGLVAISVPAAWQGVGDLGDLVKPRAYIDVVSPSPSDAPHAVALKESLQAAMLRFDTLTLGAETSSTSGSSDYQITVNYEKTDDTSLARWSIIDERKRRLIDAGIEEISHQGLQHELADKRLATLLAVKFSERDGAIANAEIIRAKQGATGNACILRAYKVVRMQDQAQVAPVVDCLERTVATDPGNAVAYAFLSRTLLMRGDPPSIDRAADLADQAVTLDPSSDVAQLALAHSQFAKGRLDAATGAARRAFLVKALDAFRRQDWVRSARIADEISSRSKMARVVRAAALANLAASPLSLKNLAELRARYPDLHDEGSALIRAQLYPPEFADALQRGFSVAAPETTASVH